jgi:hypothetical protein
MDSRLSVRREKLAVRSSLTEDRKSRRLESNGVRRLTADRIKNPFRWLESRLTQTPEK